MNLSPGILLLICGPALAAPTTFAVRAPYAGGAAVIIPADGGEYVHAAPAPDGRLRTRPILVAAPERQTYVFFSAEEEQALLRFRDRELAAQVASLRLAARALAKPAPSRLNWPRVVVQDGGVCVPELASSEAADWREHLICHGVGEGR